VAVMAYLWADSKIQERIMRLGIEAYNVTDVEELFNIAVKTLKCNTKEHGEVALTDIEKLFSSQRETNCQIYFFLCDGEIRKTTSLSDLIGKYKGYIELNSTIPRLVRINDTY
jgi:hypothetical protein